MAYVQGPYGMFLVWVHLVPTLHMCGALVSGACWGWTFPLALLRCCSSMVCMRVYVVLLCMLAGSCRQRAGVWGSFAAGVDLPPWIQSQLELRRILPLSYYPSRC